jgi:hypothetical protein
LKTEHFEVESEMLMAFLAAGRRVEFVPIQVIRSRRGSRIHPVADSLRWLKWWRNFGKGTGARAARPRVVGLRASARFSKRAKA